jgi:hypothetical protein
MIDRSKAQEVENGFLVENGPFYTGGSASPVGLDLPVDTFYLQTDPSGVLIWRKFGAGVNDWRRLSAQDVPFTAVPGTVETNLQNALEDAMSPNQAASESGNTTTNSATDALIAGMSIVAPSNGKYIASFQTTLSHGTNNASSFLSIYAGGTQVSNSEILFNRANLNAQLPVFISVPLSVSGNTAARTVETRWRTSAGTVTSNNFRFMSLTKVSPA